jgi:hypothetical protein
MNKIDAIHVLSLAMNNSLDFDVFNASEVLSFIFDDIGLEQAVDMILEYREL